MSAATVCPVVGTTNTVLPPSHPDFDPSVKGQVCPITNATTDHHHNLIKHPSISITVINNAPSNDASGIKSPSATECPALQDVQARSPIEKKLDESVCPVVGPVTTVLPPNHPSVEGKEDTICPVTNASMKHHLGKVQTHPAIEAGEGKVCPVVGSKAATAA